MAVENADEIFQRKLNKLISSSRKRLLEFKDSYGEEFTIVPEHIESCHVVKETYPNSNCYRLLILGVSGKEYELYYNDKEDAQRYYQKVLKTMCGVYE